MTLEHNLKNRPIIPNVCAICSSCDKQEAWFQGFEKELREKIIRLGQIRAGSLFDNYFEAGWIYGLLKVLGIAPKFRSRKEVLEWINRTACHYHRAEEAKKEILGE